MQREQIIKLKSELNGVSLAKSKTSSSIAFIHHDRRDRQSLHKMKIYCQALQLDNKSRVQSYGLIGLQKNPRVHPIVY